MAKITVLLGTYNGERFLDEQVASLATQDVPQLDVVASDDGSTDRTRAILESWRQRWTKGRFTILRGPSRGFAENFRYLLQAPGITDGYVAFCDQDDVWDPDKLSAALAVLEPESGPAVYGSRTRIVDHRNRRIGLSLRFPRRPTFRNAIVQSVAGGNTMVLNPAAAALVAESARRTGFVSHDWWCYLMVTGAGGRVLYDKVPHVGYRQHENNLVGDKRAIMAQLRRLRMGLQGRLAKWNDHNLAGLDACADLLNDDARAVVAEFKAARSKPGPRSIVRIARTRIYRQTIPGSFALWVAALIGKV